MNILTNNKKERIQSAYTISNYIVWAIPLVGFIGTILGISNAMESASGVNSSDKIQQILARTEVTSQISVAFDTTLVSLVLSMLGALLYRMSLKKELSILTESESIAIELSALSEEEIVRKERNILFEDLDKRKNILESKIEEQKDALTRYQLEIEESSYNINKLEALKNHKDLLALKLSDKMKNTQSELDKINNELQQF